MAGIRSRAPLFMFLIITAAASRQALAAVPDGSSAQILARNVEISGNLVLKERCAEITLLGGHAPGFATIDGRTTLVGSVTVSCGSLAVQGIAIRKN